MKATNHRRVTRWASDDEALLFASAVRAEGVVQISSRDGRTWTMSGSDFNQSIAEQRDAYSGVLRMVCLRLT